MRPFPYILLVSCFIQTVSLPAFANGLFFQNNTSVLGKNSTDASTHIQASSSTDSSQGNIQKENLRINTSASVNKGWIADASLLYWNAKSDGFDFVQKGNRTVNFASGSSKIPTSVDLHSQEYSLPFDTWDVGCIVGLGYIFPQREQWATHFGWTHLNTSNHTSVSVPISTINDVFLLPSIVPLFLGHRAQGASASWHLQYNMLDAELGRAFFVGKWLAIKPIIGLRGGWIHQKFTAKYQAVFDLPTVTFPLNTLFKSHQELSCVGARIGSDLKWYMGDEWSLLGNLFTSILWTSIDMTQRIDGYTFPGSTSFLPVNTIDKHSYNKLRTNLEGQLGLQWEKFYHQDKYRFAISTLYTFSYWFSINQLTNQIVTRPNQDLDSGTIPLISNGDLQLQGMNIKLDFDF